ncbi:MAG: hypothetical protein K2K25_07890 [Muribaculaceae bacterium]|nr:hypothetical protein [Muribaculaceae bacterium]MDE6696786.1 hypothetical protein [Muribaculaceae bacterium]
MKEILKNIFLVLTLAFVFVACDDKHDELPYTGPRDNAEKLAVGEYVGEWKRVNVRTNAEESGEGSIVFSVNEELGNNVSIIGMESSLDLGLPEGVDSSVCNISRLSSGYLTYWNYTKANPFGFTFYGKISPEGKATITYTSIILNKKTHREITYLYTFEGTKR